jgi:CO dehydrogenase maturation factor
MAIIAFSGKGGTGKSTLSALTVRYFAERGELVLALDFDPDSHLGRLLGTPVSWTIGLMVDRMHREKNSELEPQKPVDISDQEYFFSLVAGDVLVEGDGFDLVTLGRPFNEIDCYCPAFMWAEYAVSRLMKGYGTTYSHVVVDCDPGTEIFPRRILDKVAGYRNIDLLFTVLDGSRMSLDTAGAIVAEAGRRQLRISRVAAIGNRIDDPGLCKALADTTAQDYRLGFCGCVGTDPELQKINLAGGSVAGARDLSAYRQLKAVLDVMIG